MFQKTKKAEAAAMGGSAAANKKGVPSVISSDLHMLGNLISEGLIDVDGSIEGNVKAEQVTIRPNGKIRGDINAQAVHVYGEVHGLIRAQSVHLYSSCHVEGVIIHHSLSVEDGAFIDGKFKRTQEKNLGDMTGETSSSDADSDGFDEMPGSSNSLRLIG